MSVARCRIKPTAQAASVGAMPRHRRRDSTDVRRRQTRGAHARARVPLLLAALLQPRAPPNDAERRRTTCHARAAATTASGRVSSSCLENAIRAQHIRIFVRVAPCAVSPRLSLTRSPPRHSKATTTKKALDTSIVARILLSFFRRVCARADVVVIVVVVDVVVVVVVVVVDVVERATAAVA